MPARRVGFARSDLSLPERPGASQSALTAAPVALAGCSRSWSIGCGTLLAIEHAPADAAAEMLRRTEHLMVVLIEDRGRWPQRDSAFAARGPSEW